jgi:hypothetical protein
MESHGELRLRVVGDFVAEKAEDRDLGAVCVTATNVD